MPHDGGIISALPCYTGRETGLRGVGIIAQDHTAGKWQNLG
jgi:hypothetical protein